MQVEECLKNLNKLDNMDVAFLSGIHSHDRNVILKYCIKQHIQVYVIPRVGDVLMSGAKQIHMFHLPMLRTGCHNPQPEYLFFKRLADILISGVATIILSPIMIVTAIAIKAYDRGPVFYSQTRLTKDGKEFGVLKFRSMKVNAEKDGVARLSSGENDPRITPVGRFIRKCRIDEIPQLLNILKGDMSLIGPRPLLVQYLPRYNEEQHHRHDVRPGLTGYAQAHGRNAVSWEEKFAMDVWYVNHVSMKTDIKVILDTVKTVVKREGISSDTSVTMEEFMGSK